MTKKHTMPDVKEGNVNVTPLIDVVMCLIVFFMLVAKIGISGSEQMDNLVGSILGVTINDLGNTITLNVHKQLGRDGLPEIKVMLPNASESRIILPEELTPIIKEWHRLLKEKGVEGKIIVRAEGDAPYSVIPAALIICANAGITNVDFNTKIK